MTDRLDEMLERAAQLGAPPENYWRDYSARLRERIEGVDVRRRGNAWAWWLAVPATATIAAAMLYFRPEPLPVAAPATQTTTRIAEPVAPAPAPAKIESATAPAERKVEPAAHDPLPSTLPLRPRVAHVAPAPREEAPSITSISGSAVQEAIRFFPTATSTAPPTLRLTDHRLLRNGVEIARGAELASVSGGVVWFVDERGQRFALSTTPHEGFQQAGIAKGNTLTFQSDADQYQWVSSQPIVESETTLYVRRDAIQRLPQRHDPQRWRRPRPLLPFPGTVHRLPLPGPKRYELGQAPHRSGGEAVEIGTGTITTPLVTVGSAASPADLDRP